MQYEVRTFCYQLKSNGNYSEQKQSLNTVIGGFSWVHLTWLAEESVRLQPTAQLHCRFTTLHNNWWKIKQLMQQ